MSSMLTAVLPLAAPSVHSDSLVDPTRPFTNLIPRVSTPAATPTRRWSLESTLVSDNRRVAVINGELVSEGELVNGARVVSIRLHEVLITTGNRRITLHLLPDIARKKP